MTVFEQFTQQCFHSLAVLLLSFGNGFAQESWSLHSSLVKSPANLAHEVLPDGSVNNDGNRFGIVRI